MSPTSPTSRVNESGPSPSSAQQRAVGALVGLAVGDAVGTTLEFAAPGSFAPITDMVGGGPFGLRPGQWTDDTSMAMCLAESILDTGNLDPADQLRRYVLWRSQGYWSAKDHCFDIGNATSAALSRFERTGAVIDSVVDQEAAANGSLMRLAGVPIRWHHDLAIAAQRSGESSLTTHGAARPVDACRVMGAMLAGLISGEAYETVTSPQWWRWGPLDERIEAVLAGSWSTKTPPEIRGTGYVVDALEAALWAVGDASCFEDAVLRAANLGDDADTTAAIAGQLAGARWGVDAIPARWLEQLHERDRIIAVATRLYDYAVREAGEQPGAGRWAHDHALHAYWVEPGRVLAGEYPGDLNAAAARTKLNLLVDHGIRTFVDLTDPIDGLSAYGELLDEVATNRALELRRIAHPITDMGTVERLAYDQIMETIRTNTAHGGVYLHCWGGIGRTATVVGCWLVDTGYSGDEALSQITAWRSVTRKHAVDAPQTEAQRRVVRSRSESLGEVGIRGSR